jgi:Protein of unknown function (DUF4232)
MRRLHSPVARLVGAAALASAAVLIPAAALGAAAPSAGPDSVVGPGAPLAPTAASTPKCATSGLVVWLNTQGDGAAGSISYTLEFTNLSARTCTVGGYPGVSAVNLAGHQLGSAASRDTAHTPRTVTLTSGASAVATLRIVEAGNFPSTTCHQVTAAGLRVFPPNLTASKVVPFPFSACSSTGPVYLTIRAVQHA